MYEKRKKVTCMKKAETTYMYTLCYIHERDSCWLKFDKSQPKSY